MSGMSPRPRSGRTRSANSSSGSNRSSDAPARNIEGSPARPAGFLVPANPQIGDREMDVRLDGRTALITGSSLGLGKAMAACFAEAGAKVRSEEHTSELQSLMRISYAVFCLKKKKY